MKSKNVTFLSLFIGIMLGNLIKCDVSESMCLKIKMNNSEILSNDQSESWSIPLPWYGDNIIVDSNDDIYVLSDYSWKLRIMKYSNSGDLLWNITHEIPDINIIDFAIDSKNNLYLADNNWNEFTRKDIYMYKFNSSGDLLWQWSWIELYNQDIADIAIDSNDNVYLYGSTNKYEIRKNDIFILEFNSSGYQQTFYLFKDINDYVEGNDIEIDSNNTLIVSGINHDFDESEAMPNRTWIRKYDNSFKLKEIVTRNSYSFYQLVIDSVDNIITLDYIGEKTYLMKYNLSGDLLWRSAIEFIFPEDIVLDSNDEIYLSGEVSIPNDDYTDDLYITKITNSGNYDWRITWGGIYDEYHHGIDIDSNNNIFLCSGRFLLKNPQNNGKPLKNTKIMVFYLFLFGVSCVISAFSIYYIIKPYIHKRSKYKI